MHVQFMGDLAQDLHMGIVNTASFKETGIQSVFPAKLWRLSVQIPRLHIWKVLHWGWCNGVRENFLFSFVVFLLVFGTI